MVSWSNEKYIYVWKKTLDYHNKHYPSVDYYDFLPQFEQNAISFNADKLISMVKATGAQYIVVTVKHHDGVSLYPSKYGLYHTDRDFIGEIEVATRKRNIAFGVYYSLMEWTPIYSKGYKKVRPYVDDVMIPQMKEIIERYKPDIFWTDGDWQHTQETWKTESFLDWLFEESIVKDTVTINDRWGKNNTISSDERYAHRMVRNVSDRYVPEEKEDAWEHVNTIGLSWGYAKNQSYNDYKTVDLIEAIMKNVSSKGGRFMLNIGPQSSGDLDPREEEVLKELNFNNI